MAEYVTLIEAAELEDVKYNTMVRRITRNPDKFDTMTEKSENGGKDAVLVAIASLSKKPVQTEMSLLWSYRRSEAVPRQGNLSGMCSKGNRRI